MKLTKPILIVDDDQSYRAVLRCHLEALGYGVFEAEDGVQASLIVSHIPLQLIILDIVMPRKEGLETISQLRHAGIRTKILAISGADAGCDYLKIAVAMGADAKIEKMRPMSDLLKVVELLAEDANQAANLVGQA